MPLTSQNKSICLQKQLSAIDKTCSSSRNSLLVFWHTNLTDMQAIRPVSVNDCGSVPSTGAL